MNLFSKFLGASLLSLSVTVFCVAAAQPQEATTNKAGEALYKQRCAACHEGAVPKAPNRAALKEMSPENIRFALLRGSMAVQGLGLTTAQDSMRKPTKARMAAVFALTVAPLALGSPAQGQTKIPEWCKPLPRPEYKTLERVLPTEPWFEIYKVAPSVFAIYEPHQEEEIISYLIVGTKQALLFDTGMGMANIRSVVSRLTSRPVVVLNSHTHNDHVGDNWRFSFVYGMDTAFTRANAKGSREDAQAEIAPGQICGELPKGFNPKTYATKPWHISLFVRDGFKINLGGRTLEIIATPGHTPDAICLIDRAKGLLFTGDTYYPAPIWLFRPETDLDAYVASVKRLAALAPQVKLVLGAHNIPVAQPDVLPKLVEAIQAVRSGKGEVKPEGAGKVLDAFEGFQFLLAEPKKGIN